MILITGIAGFIGSATAKRLIKDGHNILGIDNFNDYYDPSIKRARAKKLINLGAKIIDIDLSQDYETMLMKYKIESIIHIAASAGVRPSIDRPLSFIENNIIVTTKLLEFAKNNNIKNIVFASSSSVYGNILKNIKDGPLAEDDVKKGIYSPYAATKMSNEFFNHTYSNVYGLSIASLRYFTVYGPDQRPDLAIIKFIKAILKNENIDKYGDGESFRDYTFIDDVVEANIKALNWTIKNPGKSEIFNICSNNAITLNDLIKTIEKETNRKFKINQLEDQLGDVKGTYGNNDKANKILGWYPKQNINDGLRETIKWVEENIDN